LLHLYNKKLIWQNVILIDVDCRCQNFLSSRTVHFYRATLC